MHSVSVRMDVGMGMGMAGGVVVGGDWGIVIENNSMHDWITMHSTKIHKRYGRNGLAPTSTWAWLWVGEWVWVVTEGHRLVTGKHSKRGWRKVDGNKLHHFALQCRRNGLGGPCVWGDVNGNWGSETSDHNWDLWPQQTWLTDNI